MKARCIPVAARCAAARWSGLVESMDYVNSEREEEGGTRGGVAGTIARGAR